MIGGAAIGGGEEAQVVVAEAEVDGQVGKNAPVVLNEERPIRFGEEAARGGRW